MVKDGVSESTRYGRARDIEWLDRLGDALAEARRRSCPVVVEPIGVGIGRYDDW
jgi:hypothetical protein